MSIASKLTKLETDITNAYDAVQIKGGTIPSNKNTENLSTAINSISGGGGGKPEQSKTVTPTTSSQTILPDEGYTLSSVTVNAVTSSIDSDIKAENIKKGVSILGVSGELQSTESLIDRTITKATVPVSAGTIRDYLFDNCTNLEEIIIEYGITAIKTYGFNNCTKLRRINFPDSIQTIEGHAFDSVPLTGYIKLPSSLTTLNGAFRSCREVTAFDIPTGVKNIVANTFASCTALDTIILRSNTLCALGSTNAFVSTPFKTTGGTAYVPSTLISQYESATNWSSLRITFVAIEGSEYE